MTLRKSIEVFFGLLSLCWDKWSREPIPGRLWIILDDLPEGKNCSVRPSRIHEGLFDSCEGLIEGRLTFFFFLNQLYSRLSTVQGIECITHGAITEKIWL